MPEAVLDILKYFFLFLIFLFLARAVKAMLLEISGPRARQAAAPAPGAAPVRPAVRPPDRMVITSADSKPRSYEIVDELIIGRADKCQVVISDSYASQVHARVFKRQDRVFLEDMGSTNGTYLNRKRVTAAVPVNRGDTGRIGKTQMEFKR